MKYIGIVSRLYENTDGDFIHGIGEDYRKALLKYEGVYPILILPPKDVYYSKTSSSKELQEDRTLNSKLDDLLDLCDGFIIPGGVRWFSYDEYIIEYALKMDKPILGICLGMQLMGIVDNKMNDGIFTENNLINTGFNHLQVGVDYVHSINICKGSKLESILGNSRFLVNSRHRYSNLGVVNFVVSAKSDDGIIESIEHPNKKFALGVQWHPESMINYDDDMKKIFDSFVNVILNG